MDFKTTMKGIPTDGNDALYTYTSQFIQLSDINNGHKETCFVLLDLLGLLKTVI